ncbi:P-loop containing nucleoside triphosphate hydrolase protein [Trichophaea hybrida]|nr:P-loop containing nucleoside triphosphate hydrolase protein [Trichophaea hybrida]
MSDKTTSDGEASHSRYTTTDPESASIPTDTLNSLQSKEHLTLLNEIDKLRSHGVSEFVSLPQLVVCGDQSSGKSSVLEAITEIPFPTRDNLCTRFVTSIKLRRSPQTEAHVKIIPDSQRSPGDKEKLGKFSGEITDFSEFPDLVEKAKAVMGLDNREGAFSRDILSIEVAGPDKPQLTIVDLPGLIHTANKMQSRADVELVSELVGAYMADQRTIILAVVTAKNDYANQIVLKRAKEADPEGLRTLGLITKPDCLPTGSASEGDFIALARNKDIYFKLGWHVLRNRSYEERDCSFDERNRIEKKFFARGSWKGLDTGIEALRTRLSVLLLNHIKKELPRVRQEIYDSLKECEQELENMGQRRTTLEEQRMMLFRISEKFGHLCRAGIEGTYENPFFGLTEEPSGQQKRLRAQVQTLNAEFAKKMRLRGHWRKIVDSEDQLVEAAPNQPKTITRAQWIEWVQPLLAQGRGRELPGTYNPLIIGELFWMQSKRWEQIAQRHMGKVYNRCNAFLRSVLKDLAPVDVIEGLLSLHINHQMEKRLELAANELEGLLEDRRRQCITYNHYFTDELQKIREKRLKDRYESVIDAALGGSPGKVLNKGQLMHALFSPKRQPDMDNYACEEVLDCMLAFYKVAYKTFVDNVAIIVVERQLVSNLWDIFSPMSIMGMSDSEVSAICEEAPEDLRKREQLEAKRVSLSAGLEACGRALKGVRGTSFVRRDFGDDEDSSDEEEEEAAEEEKQPASFRFREDVAKAKEKAPLVPTASPAASSVLFGAASSIPIAPLVPTAGPAASSALFGTASSNPKASLYESMFTSKASDAAVKPSPFSSAAVPGTSPFGTPKSSTLFGAPTSNNSSGSSSTTPSLFGAKPTTSNNSAFGAPSNKNI